jgi:hypothetical protein
VDFDIYLQWKSDITFPRIKITHLSNLTLVLIVQADQYRFFDDMVCVPLMRINDRNTVLKLAQDVVIPAATEALMKLSVPRQFQHKTSINETYAPLKNKFLLVQRALIHPKSNFTVCSVKFRLTPRKLRANTMVATITSIDVNDPYNKAMLSMNVDDSPPPNTAVNKVKLPSHQEQLKFFQTMVFPLDNTNLIEDQFSEIAALLYQFQDIFCVGYEQLPVSKLPPCHINLQNTQPKRQKRYPLPPQQERVLEEHVDKLMRAGIVLSNIPWNAPAILVRKAHFDPTRAEEASQWRLVVDYRRVNQQIIN